MGLVLNWAVYVRYVFGFRVHKERDSAEFLSGQKRIIKLVQDISHSINFCAKFSGKNKISGKENMLTIL